MFLGNKGYCKSLPSSAKYKGQVPMINSPISAKIYKIKICTCNGQLLHCVEIENDSMVNVCAFLM